MIYNFINGLKTQWLARLLAALLLIFVPVAVVVALAFGIALYVKDIALDAYNLFTREVPKLYSDLFKIVKKGGGQRG